MAPKFTKWRKHGSPLIDIGGPGETDCKRIALPDVVRDAEGYKLYYTSYRPGTMRICLATSPDGLKFTTHPANPILAGGTSKWDSKGVGYTVSLKEGDLYKMWFAGLDGESFYLCYAESHDGINWRRHPEPVMMPGPEGTCDDRGAMRAGIVREKNGYRLVYPGWDHNGRMALAAATSPDGLHWERYSGNPVIRPEPGHWDHAGIEDVHLLLLDGTYYVTYSGKQDTGTHWYYRIGLAVSQDGEHFEKLREPILDLGLAGSFDELYAAGNQIVRAEDGWRLYYQGRDAEGIERISVAYLEE